MLFFLHSSIYSLKFYREEFKLGPHRGFIVWDESILWVEKWCIKDILKENSSICKGLLQPNGGNIESLLFDCFTLTDHSFGYPVTYPFNICVPC